MGTPEHSDQEGGKGHHLGWVGLTPDDSGCLRLPGLPHGTSAWSHMLARTLGLTKTNPELREIFLLKENSDARMSTLRRSAR